MARISPEDKAKAFPDEVGELPKKWLDATNGVPMFWGETKSVRTWEVLMSEVGAKVCVDLSPGSGLLAAACMSKGIQYVGVVTNDAHHKWLTNVIDRASLAYMCTVGNNLYQEDLATHLKEIFSDLMDQEPDAGAEEAIALTDEKEE